MGQKVTRPSILLSKTQKKRFFEIISQFKKARILVIGDFILDHFIWGKVERISPEAPVPVVHVQKDSYMPGGSLNVANNIHTLGGIVYPVGVVGRDREGRMLRKVIRQAGIDPGGIVYDRHRPTALKTRVIAHSQQVVRFDREKTECVSDEIQKNILKFFRQRLSACDVIIIEDYGKGVIEETLLKEVVHLARKQKKPVLVDPKEKHFSYYQGVTAITPNRKEAYGGFLNGRAEDREYSLDEVGWGLVRQLNSEAVLMTLGEDGMALYERNGSKTTIPTAAREVFDVSGAGDTVIAVFGLALACGAKMKEAAVISNLAAGIVVGKLGTATVSQDELKQAVQKL